MNRGHVFLDRCCHVRRILPRHQPAGDVRRGPVRDDRVAAPAGDAVDLQCRSRPEPLQRGESWLSEQCRQPQFGAVVVLVEGHRCDLGLLDLAQRGDPVVEAGHGDAAVTAVQTGEDLDQGVHRIGDGTSVPSGVQVTVGPGDLDVQRQQPFRSHRQGRLARPPHRSVGGDDEIGREIRSVGTNVVGQVRAADLLLALEQESDVERESVLLRDELPQDLESDVNGSLVVGDAAPAEAAISHRQLERRGDPLLQVARRLDVVVTVDQHRRRSRRAHPLPGHRRVTARLDDPGVGKVEFAQHPVGGPEHGLPGRIQTHAGDRDVVGELRDVAVVVRLKGKHVHRRSRSSVRSPRTRGRR